MVSTRGNKGRGDRNGSHKGNPDRSERSDRGGGGGEIVSRVREGASGAFHSVLEGAQNVTQQIKETTGEVTGAVFDTLLDEAERIYKKQKKPALSRISGLSKMADRTAHALHAVKADGVAQYVEQAAEQVGSVTDYLDDRSLEEILEDAGELVKRNRAIAMGGMFVVGFAIARFLKASASRDENEDAEESGGGGGAADEDEQRERPPRRKQKRSEK